MIIFHASGEIVEFPEIRKAKYTKDFSWGFYCTNNLEQAGKWAKRDRKKASIINRFEYREKPNLTIKKFDTMTDEWLDFIVSCRKGKTHNFDIVEGAMADDTIWDNIEDFIAEDITRAAFWELAKFKHPTHQISFHTLQAIDCLTYVGSDILDK